MDLRTTMHLFIFRNLELPDHYFIVYGSEIEGTSFFIKTTRIGTKYGVEPADGVPYWHPHYRLEKVLQTTDADERLVEFVKKEVAEEKPEGKLDIYGWYILKEIDIEKWKELYQSKLTEQRKKLQDPVQKEKKTEQIRMF